MFSFLSLVVVVTALFSNIYAAPIPSQNRQWTGVDVVVFQQPTNVTVAKAGSSLELAFDLTMPTEFIEYPKQGISFQLYRVESIRDLFTGSPVEGAQVLFRDYKNGFHTVQLPIPVLAHDLPTKGNVSVQSAADNYYVRAEQVGGWGSYYGASPFFAVVNEQAGQKSLTKNPNWTIVSFLTSPIINTHYRAGEPLLVSGNYGTFLGLDRNLTATIYSKARFWSRSKPIASAVIGLSGDAYKSFGGYIDVPADVAYGEYTVVLSTDRVNVYDSAPFTLGAASDHHLLGKEMRAEAEKIAQNIENVM